MGIFDVPFHGINFGNATHNGTTIPEGEGGTKEGEYNSPDYSRGFIRVERNPAKDSWEYVVSIPDYRMQSLTRHMAALDAADYVSGEVRKAIIEMFQQKKLIEPLRMITSG
jgi:hypothetical protein